MHALPKEWKCSAVPMNAPRPKKAWLAARVEAMLSHFYQPDLSREVEALAIADWVDALSDIPGEAVERAIKERLLSANTRRPTPGEIRKAARAKVERPPSKPEAPAPYAPATDAEIAKRQEIIRRVNEAIEKSGPIQRAIEAVSDVTGVPIVMIKGDRRNPAESKARFMAMRLARETTGESYPAMGLVFRKDHTTVMHGVRRADELLTECQEFSGAYQRAASALAELSHGDRE